MYLRSTAIGASLSTWTRETGIIGDIEIGWGCPACVTCETDLPSLLISCSSVGRNHPNVSTCWRSFLEHTARQRVREGAIDKNRHTVDEDVRDTRSEFVCVGVGVLVGDRVGIEDDEIREGAGANDPAVRDAEDGRRQAGHRADRALQGKDAAAGRRGGPGG